MKTRPESPLQNRRKKIKTRGTWKKRDKRPKIPYSAGKQKLGRKCEETRK
jgi:hypothetical protein